MRPRRLLTRVVDLFRTIIGPPEAFADYDGGVTISSSPVQGWSGSSFALDHLGLMRHRDEGGRRFDSDYRVAQLGTSAS